MKQELIDMVMDEVMKKMGGGEAPACAKAPAPAAPASPPAAFQLGASMAASVSAEMKRKSWIGLFVCLFDIYSD